VAPDGTRRVKVAIDGHARATVVLAPAHPPAPPAEDFPLRDERPPSITGDQVYEQRWMFHDEAYQGIRELGRLGADGIVGILESRPAPGALLDNAGQLIGIWMGEMVDDDRLALPVSIERIDLFGPHPAPGERLECRVRIVELEPQSIRCDLELIGDAGVWARIVDWNDRRFATDPRVFDMLCWPEKRLLAQARPGGYVLVRETWLDSASRDLMMRRYLTGDEQDRYGSHHPNGQRQFLLGRMAAKDAARGWLWEHGHGDLFPAEVAVANDESGRPLLTHPGDADLRVSIAHTTGLGVAVLGEGVDVGIDIELVEERSDRFEQLVLTDAEQALDPPPALAGDRDAWRTALWAAKEAVAKAQGTGLQGRPKDFEVTRVDGDDLVVAGRRVHLDRLIEPPPTDRPTDAGTPERREHIVAWTTD
jgi:phosphopantetheinyl transferase (holo-ACP synthase)